MGVFIYVTENWICFLMLVEAPFVSVLNFWMIS
jgi:hypothetical protein